MTIVRVTSEALRALPEEVDAVADFARRKAETGDFRSQAERASRLFASRVDGLLAEFYVSRHLNLAPPDLSIHGGDHGSDVGEYQVKACDFDRWTAEERSFVFYPEALAKGEGTILGVAFRGRPDARSRRNRLLWRFDYEDARALARDPFTASARARGARAVYVADLWSSCLTVQ